MQFTSEEYLILQVYVVQNVKVALLFDQKTNQKKPHNEFSLLTR